MKLNPDCVRDTLLTLEEELTINCETNQFEYITLHQLTEKIVLHHLKLEQQMYCHHKLS